MDCDQVRTHLQDFIDSDDALTPIMRESISSHFATCSACAEEATVMRSLGDRIRQGLNAWVGEGMTPPQLAHRIAAQIRVVGPKPWWRTWQGSAGITVAAAAVLVALVGNQLDGLTDMLGRPVFELHLSAAPAREQLINRPIQVVEPKGSIHNSDQGVSLSLDKVELYADFTRIT